MVLCLARGAGGGIEGVGSWELSYFFASALLTSPSSGAAYAVNGFRNAFDLVFWGRGLEVREGRGLEARFVGRKPSPRTCTKLEGKTPTCLFRYNLPVHHCPSPAFSASIKSPSMNPRSRFDSPLNEYIAFVHIGNRVGSPGACVAMVYNASGPRGWNV